MDTSHLNFPATPRVRPTVHLLASLTAFTASFDVSIVTTRQFSGTPLEIRVWYPGARSSVFIRFNSAGEIVGGSQEEWRDLASTRLLAYPAELATHVTVRGDPSRLVRFTVTTANGASKTYAVRREDGLTLFKQPYLDLSVGALGTVEGAAQVHLTKFRLTTPAASYLASRIDDVRASAAAVLVVAWFVGYLFRRRSSRRSDARNKPEGRSWLSLVFDRSGLLIVVTVVGALVLVAALAFIDGHPYDRLSQETWSYVIQHYGVGSLYDRTITAPDSAVRGGGSPWSTLGYSYPPGMIYPYAFFAGIWKLMGGAIAPLHDRPFYVFWKVCFSLFILLDGWLVYLIATRVTQRSRQWAAAAALLFVFNPAVLFDAAVWGETDALLTAALLISAFGFLSGRVRIGFAGIAVACVLKQTALFFLPLLFIYSVRRYGLRQSLGGGAVGVLSAFTFLVPTILVGYHPGTAYPNGFVQLKAFALPSYTWVSADTFSVWTLVTPLRGFHGFDRVWPPSLGFLPGTRIGYSTAGTVLFLTVVAISLVLVTRLDLERLSPWSILTWASVIPLAFVIFSTTASVRYVTLGLPFLLLSVRRPVWPRGAASGAVYLVTSAIAVLSMYGLFTIIAERGEWPNFNGLGNAKTDLLSQVVHTVYTSDLGITVMAIALCASLVALLWLGTGGDERVRPPLTRLALDNRD